MKLRFFFPAAALAFFIGCGHTNVELEVEQTSPAEIEAMLAESDSIALDEMPNDIHWVRNSAEKHAIYLQTYRWAGQKLERLAESREPGTWAVSLDADETLVDNSLYQKELVIQETSYNPDTWNEWVNRREATALPGAKEFLAKVRDLGGRIIVVSNRYDVTQQATEDNLNSLGLDYDLVLLRQGSPDKQKERRWNAIQDGTASDLFDGLEIIMYLGDNIEDFPLISQEILDGGDGAFDERFGTEFIVFPNPMYGSWGGNLKD